MAKFETTAGTRVTDFQKSRLQEVATCTSSNLSEILRLAIDNFIKEEKFSKLFKTKTT